jgi:lysosomal Pro-X carboxypeptidase
MCAGTEDCFNPWKGVNKETALVGDLWDYQYCTEQFMPMAKSGKEDIYWNEPWNETAARLVCKGTWGMDVRPLWGTIQWGGRDLRTLTNVVFSNGLYDPWHLGGVLHDLSDTVKVCFIVLFEANHKGLAGHLHARFLSFSE